MESSSKNEDLRILLPDSLPARFLTASKINLIRIMSTAAAD
jgi:hypothetical protein